MLRGKNQPREVKPFGIDPHPVRRWELADEIDRALDRIERLVDGAVDRLVEALGRPNVEGEPMILSPEIRSGIELDEGDDVAADVPIDEVHHEKEVQEFINSYIASPRDEETER